MKLETKIIATIGPATIDSETFQKVINEGVDYIRINSSFGNYGQYDQILKNLERAEKSKKIEIILDIKEMHHLNYAINNEINHIALSFAETTDQIKQVREKISNCFLISKIESKKGVENFDEILELSDGIMVARGDLGEAVNLENVPPLQKDFTIKTLLKDKFLVTATEMLLSMVENPKPTRAEASDVANAVFDFSSAVMLSEETAIGKYPTEAVKYMRLIIEKAEIWNQKNLHNI